MTDLLPIVDFHCDLLVYLQSKNLATAFDDQVNCSIPQMRRGGVKTQVCAIYASGDEPQCAEKGKRQINIFNWLPEKYFGDFRFVNHDWWDDMNIEEEIGIMPAIESASAICGPEEPLEKAFERIAYIEEHICKLAYISLTWNENNRFGGGAQNPGPLKEDGRELLNWMHQRKIAVDLSHTSDQLAHDILAHIDSNNLEIPVIASHSNCRVVVDAPRNLPDELIQEIFKREGVVGINFVRDFIGPESPDFFCKQLDHLRKLGGQERIVMGADFFYGQDRNEPYYREYGDQYHSEFSNASCYPALFELWKEKLSLGHEELVQIAHGNAINFFKNKIYA